MSTLLNYPETQIAEQTSSEVVWISFLNDMLVTRGVHVGYNLNEIIIVTILEAIL